MSLEGRVIGLIEDDPVMGESLVQSLTLEGCHVEWWRTGAEAMRALRASDPDLVVCDIRLPDMSGEDVFRNLTAKSSAPPFLFVTGYGSIDQAVALMRAGAGDYVTKPFAMPPFLARATHLIARNPRPVVEDVLGISEEMRAVEATLRRIADLTTPVLLTGETGTGKEVCARFLHVASSRSKEPFVAVNCASIPPERLDTELFGARAGAGRAFHRGFAERTRSGILFLDEVGDLSLSAQAKLLRLVEAREFHRIGGEAIVPFHGRIMCATNANLTEAISSGTFRRDLYYRINGFSVEVPSLRSRRADIPWLLDYHLERLRGEGQSNIRGISSHAHELAAEHDWPGNVRELRNRMDRALTMATGDWIMPTDLFPERAEELNHPMLAAFATLSEARETAERRQIERALSETDGQISEAARLLGISRTTLWEKMRRLQMGGGGL